MKILAIESSCDETAAAVVAGSGKADQPVKILSNIVASQIDLHKQYGGVFPELASRAHAEQIIPVIQEALEKANVKRDLAGVEAIAVTYGPGLIGSLMIGAAAAKTLAYGLNKPIIPVNHWEGHLYSVWFAEPLPHFPALYLTVSGGHTSLILMKDHGNYEILGQTRDDAAGEAFDKVAKLLSLPYPGGPVIDQLTEKCNLNNVCKKIKSEYKFPRPMVNEPGYDFSFSGLKTAVYYGIRDKKLGKSEVTAVAAALQEAIVETLIKRTEQAAKQYRPKSVCLVGGVSANKMLREKFTELAKNLPGSPSVHIPPLKLTTDNAVMIGGAGYFRALLNQKKTWYDVVANANAELV